MVSPQASDKLSSGYLHQMWDHDPGATTAIVVSPDGGTTKRVLDMRDYLNVQVGAALTVIGSASGITKLEIIASAAADMSSPEVIKDSGAIAADAIGDWAQLECTAEEVAQIATDSSKALRYVAGRLTCSHAADEAAVYYFAIPRYPRRGLTPATTIA